VSVSFGSLACIQTAPNLALSPSQSQWVSAGTAVTYNVSVTNKDNAACGAASFSLEADIPAGWAATFANPVLTLAPGASAITTLTVSSPASATDGFYAVVVTARNGGATSYAASGNVTYVVNSGTGNQTPVAMDDTAATVEGTAVTVVVLDNDFDPDGDPLTVISITQGAHGQVGINGDGSVRYLPSSRFKGTDSFSYTVSDGADTAAAAVVIVVERNSGGGNGGNGGGKPGRK
jgi:hypothetical protein